MILCLKIEKSQVRTEDRCWNRSRDWRRGQEGLLHEVLGRLAPSDSRRGIAIKGITVPFQPGRCVA